MTRMLDDGIETLEAPLPALITVTKEINQPRLATLRGRLKAKKAEIKRITSGDIGKNHGNFGLEGSPTRVIKVFRPSPPMGGELMEGSPDKLAEKILDKLIECKVI